MSSVCGSGRLLVVSLWGLGLVALGVCCLSLVVCSPGDVSLWGPSLEEARNWPEMSPKRKGADPKTGSGPKITLRQVSPRCFGTLDLSIRSIASAGHMVMCVVAFQMVGDRRFTGATILGASCSATSANHPVSVPPTGPELLDASSTDRVIFVLGRRLRFRKCFTFGPSNFLVVFSGFGPVARLSLSLWVWAWSLFVSVSVASGSVSFWEPGLR